MGSFFENLFGSKVSDVQIVRYILPSSWLEVNNFDQVKRMIKGNRQHVVLDLLPNFKMGKNEWSLW